MKKTVSALAVAAMFALPNAAVALNSSFDAMSQSGNHKFYVWCTGKDDYSATQAGDNAKAAQAALAAERAAAANAAECREIEVSMTMASII